MPGFTPPNDAGNKPRDYIGLADLRDIKAALHGKPVDPTTGKVDHAAPATTPHLRLSATWYTSQMKDLAAHKDRQQMMGLIDVVNLFIMIDDSCPKPGHCEVRQTSTKCDYEESKRLWGAHQKTDRRQGNEPPKATLNPSSVVLPFMTFLLCTR